MPTPLVLAGIEHIPAAFWLAPIGGVAALATAFMLYRSVMQRPEGDAEMIRIAEAVRKGAGAYLRSQYKIVGLVFVGLVALLGLIVWAGLEPVWAMVGVPIAGFLSALCGWFGMKTATNASARTAAAAKESLNSGLQVAFRSGAVMGLTCVGLAILDVSFWFFVFTGFGERLGLGEVGGNEGLLIEMVTILISFKMGASLQALFARVGGGIFTKAADVGADLVGKVEAGIPEDDARNPATIADNVGDNVGDVAGMGADLYESYYSSIIAAIALGVSAAFSAALGVSAISDDGRFTLALQMATIPLALAGVGIFASIVGIFTVRTKENASFHQLLKSLESGVIVASVLIAAAAFAVPWLLLRGGDGAAALAGISWWRFSLAIIAGLVAGIVIARWTEYCTSYEYRPTRSIARQAVTGPATVIITGIAEGMKSTWACLIAVVVAILVAFGVAGGNDNFLLGLYGVGIAAVGMLATLGITLATDAYGPIADNAGGNAEMSGQPPHVRERTDLLDSIGNTTAATGKGFAIGSAALTALALLAAYVQVVQHHLDKQTTKYAMEVAAEVAPEGPVAVYEGHRRFGVIVPGVDNPLTTNAVEDAYYTGAIQVSPEDYLNAEHFFGSISKGDVFPLAEPAEAIPTSRAVTLLGELTHDHGGVAETHEYNLRLITTSSLNINDLLFFYDVTLTSPLLLSGLFIGVLLTFLFCAMTMDAVGRAANTMMQECRRQFAKMREAFRAGGMSEAQIADPEAWPKQITHEGVEYPDYAQCVSIATKGALREMVAPSLLVVAVPVVTGLLLGISGVLGMLAGGLVTGFAVAVFMANAGGAWDNAKKLLESYGRISADKFLDDPETRRKVPEDLVDVLTARATELRAAGHGDAYVYGKGSEDHKATVVGDTVGDPFKDTSGPSLNILIKLLSSVAVVAAGVTVKFSPHVLSFLGLN